MTSGLCTISTDFDITSHEARPPHPSRRHLPCTRAEIRARAADGSELARQTHLRPLAQTVSADRSHESTGSRVEARYAISAIAAFDLYRTESTGGAPHQALRPRGGRAGDSVRRGVLRRISSEEDGVRNHRTAARPRFAHPDGRSGAARRCRPPWCLCRSRSSMNCAPWKRYRSWPTWSPGCTTCSTSRSAAVPLQLDWRHAPRLARPGALPRPDGGIGGLGHRAGFPRGRGEDQEPLLRHPRHAGAPAGSTSSNTNPRPATTGTRRSISASS